MNNKEELKKLLDRIEKNEIIYDKSKFNGFIITVRSKNYDKIRLKNNTVARRQKRLNSGKCVSCGSDKLEYKDELRKIKYRKCKSCRLRENEMKKKRYYRKNFIQ